MYYSLDDVDIVMTLYDFDNIKNLTKFMDYESKNLFEEFLDYYDGEIVDIFNYILKLYGRENDNRQLRIEEIDKVFKRSNDDYYKMCEYFISLGTMDEGYL